MNFWLYGLFSYGKYVPIIGVFINLGLSLILVNYIGVVGVIFGTFISRMATYSWIDPYVTYRFVLKKPLRIHFIKYAFYTVITIFTAEYNL